MKPNWKIEHLQKEEILRIIVDIKIEHVPEYVFKEFNKEASKSKFKELNEHYFSALSGREKQILGLIIQNFSNKEIAQKLHIAFNTARTHRKNIMRKLNCNTGNELMHYSIFFKNEEQSCD
ncbi:MAG: helix-turn-helix transcriptional regulator [Arachidicoccus sp.]|nr:helix-turn-helix transcriptional regulator [Arachidicoccus sp.]